MAKRVLRIYLTVVDEKDRERVLAKKFARIHSNEIGTGVYHLAMRAEEIMKDVHHILETDRG